MNLYQRERHVEVSHEAWDPARVQGWLRRWAADALELRARGDWPIHPRDASDIADEPDPASMKCQYFGAAGVWMALARLADAGHCRLPAQLTEIFSAVLLEYERAPDTHSRVPSWFLGESALLTACCLAGPDAEKADRLAAMVHANRDNPTLEALWGAPGTMLAALFMHEATGEERWASLYRDSAAALWARWTLHEPTGAWLWEQDLYGQKVRYYGAGHGWAGNLHALWRGSGLLTDEQRAALRERTVQGLARLAVTDGECSNWAPLAGPPGKMLLQWCHGAPGMITSLRHADIDEALPLLLQGARLIARAGPLAKGVAQCHGTAGNGAALLEVYRRTGDARWLAHAREFAMASLAQAEADRHEYGQWHYSLWTGDAGAACFLLDCLAGSSRGMPGLDILW